MPWLLSCSVHAQTWDWYQSSHLIFRKKANKCFPKGSPIPMPFPRQRGRIVYVSVWVYAQTQLTLIPNTYSGFDIFAWNAKSLLKNNEWGLCPEKTGIASVISFASFILFHAYILLFTKASQTSWNFKDKFTFVSIMLCDNFRIFCYLSLSICSCQCAKLCCAAVMSNMHRSQPRPRDLLVLIAPI